MGRAYQPIGPCLWLALSGRHWRTREAGSRFAGSTGARYTTR